MVKLAKHILDPYILSSKWSVYDVDQAPLYECVLKNYFLYLSSKTYAVGTQKNRLNETVLLSTQNTCLNWWVRKYLQFYAHKISLSGSMI